MTYALATVLVLLTTLPVLDASRRRGALVRPEFYLLVAIYLYGTGGYLTYLLFSPQTFDFILSAADLSVHTAYLYSACAVFAVYVGGKLYRSPETTARVEPDGRAFVVLAVLGCVLAIGFNVYYYASYGLFSGNFDRVMFIDKFESRGAFSFPYVAVLLASLSILALNERKPVSWLFVLAFALLHLPVGDRRVVLGAFIVVLVAKVIRGLRLRKRTVAAVLSVILVLGVIVGDVRGGGLSALSGIGFQRIFLALSEFSHPFVTLVYYVDHGYSLLYGASVARSLANIIPGFLLPFDKFPSLGQQFVHVVEGLGVYSGRAPGYGFYPVTEALLNFGFLGVPVFFLALAALLRNLSVGLYVTGLVFIVPVLCAAMFSFGRSPLADVVVTNFWAIAFGLAIYCAALLVSGKYRESLGKLLAGRGKFAAQRYGRGNQE